MSKVFLIPDVHLKPWIFEKASNLISNGLYDVVVLLGDIVDDWNQGRNLNLYDVTFDAAIKFVKKHRQTLWCYGNHDVSYLWKAGETGYSIYARDIVVRRIGELEKALGMENCAFIHRINNTLFSHAGLTESFVLKHFGNNEPDLDSIMSQINCMRKDEMWQDDSPIWARPQKGHMRLYPPELFQVVGHTPVLQALEEGNLLTLDSFSTYPDGSPIGNERFVWVDTISKTWGYVDEGKNGE